MTGQQASGFDFAGVGVRGPLALPLAITGVTVIPMDSEMRLPGHTVVVSGGMIRAVAPDAAVDTSGKEVVDGAGRFLLPGLADMHCHPWELSSALAYIANGVTVVRNMSGTSFHLAWGQAVQQGRLPGRIWSPTGPFINGAGPTGDLLARVRPARGRRSFDKRQAIAQQDADREIAREPSDRLRGRRRRASGSS